MRNMLITMIVAMFVLFTCNVTYSQTDFDIVNLDKDCICAKKGDKISVTCLFSNKPSFTAEFSNKSESLIAVSESVTQSVEQNEFMAILVFKLSEKETGKIPVILVRNEEKKIPATQVNGKETLVYDCYVDKKYADSRLPYLGSGEILISATIQTEDGKSYLCILYEPAAGLFGIGYFWSTVIIVILIVIASCAGARFA